MDELYEDFGNDILYRMCEEHPAHIDREVVHGKLWLIGRAYAVALERGPRGPEGMAHAVDLLLASGIDDRIVAIRKIKRIESANVAEVLELHGFLVDRFREATGIGKRSLASKYLHFHAPQAFFIYDSIAAGTLQKELKGLKRERSAAVPQGADPTYASFVLDCLRYRDGILEPKLGSRVDPRNVDKHLYRKKKAA